MKRVMAIPIILLLAVCTACTATDVKTLRTGLQIAQLAIPIVDSYVAALGGTIPKDTADQISAATVIVNVQLQRALDYSKTLSTLDDPSKAQLVGFLDPAIDAVAGVAGLFTQSQNLAIAIASLQAALEATRIVLVFTDQQNLTSADAKLKQTNGVLKSIKRPQ